MNELFWVGSRSEDIQEERIFQGSITRYGADTLNNVSFSNSHYKQYKDFVEDSIESIIRRFPTVRLIFANPKTAYSMNENIRKKAICLPKRSISNSLNDKVFMRNYLCDKVQTLPYIIIDKNCLLDYGFVSSIFSNKYDCYIVQYPTSAGGYNTIKYSNSIKDLSFLPKDSKSEYVLVTPFINNAMTVNVHILASKSNYRIFPPSIQITTDGIHYCGSDFCAYQILPYAQKEMIIDYSTLITESLMKIGCIGTMGIDLLVKGNSIFFLECNYRYQGSSCILNLGLLDNRVESLFLNNYNAYFKDIEYLPQKLYQVPINYSCFRRTVNNKQYINKCPDRIYGKNNRLNDNSNDYLEYDIYNNSIINLIEQQ